MPQLLYENQPITFQDTSSVGYNNICDTLASYMWNFGTGGPDSIVNSTSSSEHSGPLAI